ncbi:MAG: amino acid ABC transporter substrate-binding protein [Pikeienuella sp.]
MSYLKLNLSRAGIVLILAMAGFSAPVAGAGPVIDRILSQGEIRLGFRTDAPPFSALVDGRPQGFTIDLCALVAQSIKENAGLEAINARFVPVGTGKRFEAVAQGEIDILCGATTATLARREVVSFSLPVFLTGVSVVMRTDAPELAQRVLLEPSPESLSPATVASALEGLALGVRRDTTAAAWLDEAGIGGVVQVERHESAFAALESGELQGYFADRAILLGQAQALKAGEGLALSKKTFTHEPYALAIPRGDDDFRLAVDRALSGLYRSTAVVSLMERHFGPVSPDVAHFYRLTALPE